MGMDGRRQYGIGSFLKKGIRKLIPNEVAEIAVKAAPFVAPFNPIAAGLMSGIGSFDQTGRIGSSLKSGLMNYGMGQLARGLGGGRNNLQRNPFKAKSFGEFFQVPRAQAGQTLLSDSTFKDYFNSPIQEGGGLGKYLSDSAKAQGQLVKDQALANSTDLNADMMGDPVSTGMDKIIPNSAKIAKETKTTGGILKTIKDFALDNKLLTGLAAGTLGATALMGNMEPDEIQDMQRGEGLDLDSIRAEVQEAMADETGELLKALRVKYPFLGRRDTKDYAMGGRAGFAEGGGIMDLGGMEKDYRAEGGFVPIGREEKADDVPARLSVNEFVFTADAVRNAGGGDIDKGAEVMENMMKNLEAGGQVSEESQGMAGAQQMFETSQRLSEVI
jgi:hypothetical protein